MTEKTHENCATCDWLCREAESTARRLGRDTWSSWDKDRDGTRHVAHYFAEDAR